MLKHHCPIPYIQIPHHPVFSITHHAVAPPLPTSGNPLPNQRPPQKWRLKLHIALLFWCCLSLPILLSLTNWKWKSNWSPPLTLIILVMPNFELMKTLIMPLENYLGAKTDSQPPSYHMPQYLLCTDST
jgi:hypothetical protein